MKNLKIKLWLLRLSLVLVASIFVTSCEQADIVTENELNTELNLRELVQMAHQENPTEAQSLYLTKTYESLTAEEVSLFHELAVDEIYKVLDADVTERYQQEIEQEKAALKSFRKAVCQDALHLFGRPFNRLDNADMGRVVDNAAMNNEALLMSMPNIDFLAPEQQDHLVESRSCPIKNYPLYAIPGGNCSVTCFGYNDAKEGSGWCDVEFGFNTCSYIIDGTDQAADDMLASFGGFYRRTESVGYPYWNCRNYNSWILIGRGRMYAWTGPAWITRYKLRMRAY